MRRDNLFWGGVLLALGILFLLQAMQVIDDALGWFWPIFLMLLGALIVSGAIWKGSVALGETKSLIAHEPQAREAHIQFDFGASSLEVTGGAPTGDLVFGTSGSMLSISSKVEDNVQKAEVQGGPAFLPFLGPASGGWMFQLSSQIPLEIDVDGGASTMIFDLSDLQVKSFTLDGGASTIRVTAPRRGNCRMELEAGATTIEISLPAGVEGRIVTDGLMSLNADPARFTRVENAYQTAGYASASERVDIALDGGANTVTIR